MDSKKIVLMGLLASILLIFLCIYFNAEQYYKELNSKNESTFKTIKEKQKTKEISNAGVAVLENEDDKKLQSFKDALKENETFDKPVDKPTVKSSSDMSISEDDKKLQSFKDSGKSDKEMSRSSAMEDEKLQSFRDSTQSSKQNTPIKNKETSYFSYWQENETKYFSGVLPMLNDDDPFKKLIATCTAKNNCKNDIVFFNNGEVLSWKKLVLPVINLFRIEGVNDGQITVNNETVEIFGTFESQRLKYQLSSILVANNVPLKVEDKTTVDFQKASSSSVPFNMEKVQKNIERLIKEQQIHFKKGSTQLTQKSEKVLNEIVQMIGNEKNILIEVQGHTDVAGKKHDNQLLSQKRADRVKKYLIKKGTMAKNIKAIGFGETMLLLPNHPYSVLNRRVDIYLTRK